MPLDKGDGRNDRTETKPGSDASEPPRTRDSAVNQKQPQISETSSEVNR
jgi:hypothetical protein